MAKSLEDRVKEYIKNSKQKAVGEKSGKFLSNVLKEEAERLKKILISQIRAYYDSYEPNVYKRRPEAEGLLNSISIDTNTGNPLQIIVYFNENSYHPSIIYPKLPERFIPTLIDIGWKWKNNSLPKAGGKTYQIEHFTYQKGFHFVEKAIKEFNRTSKYHISIQVKSTYSKYYDKL